MRAFREDVNIIWLDSTDSTNDEIRRRKGTLDSFSAVAALSQDSGRGQGDHIWHSAPGENLTFSLFIRFPEDFWRGGCSGSLVRLNEYVTSSIVKFLSSEGVEAWVKLPNDIWVGDRKICGVLIENILEAGLVRESIIGIGLNLNETSFPDSLPNPVSLKQLTGREYSPAGVLENLMEIFSSEEIHRD